MVVFIGMVISLIIGYISAPIIAKIGQMDAKAQMEYYKKYYGDDDE